MEDLDTEFTILAQAFAKLEERTRRTLLVDAPMRLSGPHCELLRETFGDMPPRKPLASSCRRRW